MDKINHNGKVGVLVSRGYGAGWSTTEGHNPFEPALVLAIQAGMPDTELQKIAEEIYGDEYYGGVEDLTIQWVPEGTLFRIEEYDGAESLHTLDSYHWHKA